MKIRKLLTSYFRTTGGFLSYAVPVGIVISDRDDIDGKIEIGDGVFRYEGTPVFNGLFWVLPVFDHDLPPGSGIIITQAEKIEDFPFQPGQVEVTGADLYRMTDCSYRLIRHRPLSKDRA